MILGKLKRGAVQYQIVPIIIFVQCLVRGCRGRMVVEFTKPCPISAYRQVYSIQHYVIKFVNDLRQIGGFLRVLRFSSTNKTDRRDITDILLKVALNTIK